MTRPLATCLFAASLLAAAPAAAQGAREQARALFEQGVAEMNAGNPAGASQYFQRSYQLYPRASSACNMALSLERTGRACEAQNWYRQCAALDQEGRFRDHANRQAAALDGQCRQQPSQPSNPFVSGPSDAQTTQTTTQGEVQVVETGSSQPTQTYTGPGPDHTFLVVGIIGVVLGGGALTGSILTASASNDRYSMISAPPGTSESPTQLVDGTADADHYRAAEGLRNASIGLGVAAGLLGGLGLVFVIVDLAQPGVLGPSASSGEGPRLSLGSRPGGGAEASLTLAF